MQKKWETYLFYFWHYFNGLSDEKTLRKVAEKSLPENVILLGCFCIKPSRFRLDVVIR